MKPILISGAMVAIASSAGAILHASQGQEGFMGYAYCILSGPQNDGSHLSTAFRYPVSSDASRGAIASTYAYSLEPSVMQRFEQHLRSRGRLVAGNQYYGECAATRTAEENARIRQAIIGSRMQQIHDWAPDSGGAPAEEARAAEVPSDDAATDSARIAEAEADSDRAARAAEEAEQRRLAEADERLRRFHQSAQEEADRVRQEHERRLAEHRRQVAAAERARREYEEALARNQAQHEEYQRRLREHADLVARLRRGASDGPQCRTSFHAGTVERQSLTSAEDARNQLARLNRRLDFEQCNPDTLNVGQPSCTEELVFARRMFICNVAFNCQRRVCERGPGSDVRQD